MSLNNILKNKIIRPIDAPSLGIVIIRAEAWAEANSFILSVRYFNLNKPEEGTSEDRDLITVTVNDFMSQYMICPNRNGLDWKSDAYFINMESYLNEWLDKENNK